MIVLENENPPSTNCKGEGGMAGGVEIKSQKDRLDCSENNVSVSTSSQDEGTSGVEVKPEKDRLDCSASYILVSCHLEMLRHSLSDYLHLTQVSLSSFSLVFIASSPVGCHYCTIAMKTLVRCITSMICISLRSPCQAFLSFSLHLLLLAATIALLQ